MANKLTPPVTYESLSYHKTPEGDVTRVTLLIHDGEGVDYTMVLCTANDFLQLSGYEGPIHTAEEEEPAFVLPADRITPEDVDTVMTELTPAMLGRFAVRQIEGAD